MAGMQTKVFRDGEMNGEWRDFLLGQGALIEGRRVVRYGRPLADEATLSAGGVIADLSHWGLVAVHGADAATFLQGQFTNDIRAVGDDEGQLSGYCNAKGRLLALLLVYRRGDRYWLCLPLELTEAVIARLRMYTLRAKVELRDAGDACVRIGLAGPPCEAVLRQAFGRLPAEAYAVRQGDATTLLRLPGTPARFLLMGDAGEVQDVWSTAVARQATPVGAAYWQLLEIRAGIPVILPQTQERFVPQAVNLDVLHGISFTKGCYTGQEIVARMHYLGTLKQRMYLAEVQSDHPVQPGDSLYGANADTKHSIGTVVIAQPVPPGRCQALLAVLGMDAAQRGKLHLAAPDGPELILKTMPYDIAARPVEDRH